MIRFCYEFGRAVAHFKGKDFDMSDFILICQSCGVGTSCGSNGLVDAMLGAFDEYKRVADLYDSRKVKGD
jgi:hypothetical protein